MVNTAVKKGQIRVVIMVVKMSRLGWLIGLLKRDSLEGGYYYCLKEAVEGG